MKILFYPQLPKSYSKITDICRRLDIRICDLPCNHDLEGFDFGIHWDYNTYCKPDQLLLDISKELPIINLSVDDVSKSKVDAVFTSIFKYSSRVDIFQYFGYAIRKSENQAAHDGEIISLPYRQQPGYFYQKLLDSRTNFTTTQDLRLVFFKDEIPFGFLKYRPVASPIKDLSAVTYVSNPMDFISAQEYNQVVNFCHSFGLEFGEIDLVRNNSDGLLYILDVNNMAGNALFKHFGFGKAEQIRDQYAQLFKQKFQP
jgi:hypothetical protein